MRQNGGYHVRTGKLGRDKKCKGQEMKETDILKCGGQADETGGGREERTI